MDIHWKKLRLSYLLMLFLLIGFAIGASIVKFSKPELTADYSIKVINDRDYFPAVHSLLSSAKDSIHVSMFSLTYYSTYTDSDVNVLLEDLGKAHDNGVDVKVIVDEFPEDVDKGIAFLEAKGIPVKYDGTNQTTHTKLIIVDSQAVVVGSTNWRYYSVDQNHEANVIILSSKVAQEFESYFTELWEAGNEPSV